jgi:hypothetical protein
MERLFANEPGFPFANAGLRIEEDGMERRSRAERQMEMKSQTLRSLLAPYFGTVSHIRVDLLYIKVRVQQT